MVAVTDKPIDVAALLRDAGSGATGGINLFVGTVRDNAEGRPVARLEYTAYVPMAEEMMRAIEQEIRKRWNVQNVLMIHRVGILNVGDVAVAIAVGAPHRADAFEACRHAIERIKADVPVWKKEFGPEDAGGGAWKP